MGPYPPIRLRQPDEEKVRVKGKVRGKGESGRDGLGIFTGARRASRGTSHAFLRRLKHGRPASGSPPRPILLFVGPGLVPGPRFAAWRGERATYSCTPPAQFLAALATLVENNPARTLPACRQARSAGSGPRAWRGAAALHSLTHDFPTLSLSLSLSLYGAGGWLVTDEGGSGPPRWACSRLSTFCRSRRTSWINCWISLSSLSCVFSRKKLAT